jgi:hypothetical protein
MIKEKGKEGKGRSWMFFIREGGERLGLVVEGEGRRPGLVMILPVTHIPFSARVSS